MKQFYLLVLLVGLITPTGLHAQKVYKKNNKVILDLTVAAGMPKDAVTQTSKTDAYTANFPELPEQIALNKVNGIDNDQNNPINATVFQKLEVAPYDVNGHNEISSTKTEIMTRVWNLAFTGCKESKYDNGGWRLPTQRELMLIYIFNPALTHVLREVGGTPLESDNYWSATEYDKYNAWHMIFNVGFMSHAIKAEGFRIRCVREVTD